MSADYDEFVLIRCGQTCAHARFRSAESAAVNEARQQSARERASVAAEASHDKAHALLCQANVFVLGRARKPGERARAQNHKSSISSIARRLAAAATTSAVAADAAAAHS